MKKLKFLVIHCSATPKGRQVTKADIEKWHLQERGWSKVGYTDLIDIEGNLINLTPFDQDDDVEGWELTNGVRGINQISRHIVYAGGKSRDMVRYEDTRTLKQFEAMTDYVRYTVLRHPHILVAGHNQFAAKACPSFDVPDYCKQIGIGSKNIYCNG